MIVYSVDQFALQVVLPDYSVDEAVNQMEGEAIYSNGFTLIDSIKASWFYIFFVTWTLFMFMSDILNLTQRLCHSEIKK